MNIEEYLDGPYKKEWHKVWQEGKFAREQGKNKEDNPHKLKVWRAVWQHGFDNYDPNNQVIELDKLLD